MAEAEKGKSGRALRVYQIFFVLALGWLIGRLPELLADGRQEEARLSDTFALSGPASATATMANEVADTTRIAAEVAARVAAEVADQTVARLIAAGWAPQNQQPVQIMLHQPASAAPEVRIIREERPTVGGFYYDLPNGQQTAAAQPSKPQPAAPSIDPVAYELATKGYDALQKGDRRQGVALLKQAAALAPDTAEAGQWKADVGGLTRRWSVSGYTIARDGVIGDPLAASPVLGAGQAGMLASYTLNPLADRRVSIIGRVTASAGANGGLDGQTTEAALGLRVQPWRNIPIKIDGERRFALGIYSRNLWAARISAGSQTETVALGQKLKLDGYAEAGIVGRDKYAGGHAWGGVPLFTLGKTAFDVGAGTWAATQESYGMPASRWDIGPSTRFRIMPWPFFAQIDWRAKVAGNAMPGSGPVFTVAGDF